MRVPTYVYFSWARWIWILASTKNSSAAAVVAAVVVAHLAQLFTDLPIFSKIRFCFHEWGPYKRWGLVQHVKMKRIAFRVFWVSNENNNFAKNAHFQKKC